MLSLKLCIMVKARSVNNYQRRPVDDCSPGRGGMAQNSGTRAEHFMTKWIAAEKAKKAGLRHTIVSPSVTGRTKKRIAQSKRARRADSLALIASHKWRVLVSSGRLACRYHDVFLCCYVCFDFASFSSLCAFVEAATLRSIVLRYAGAPIATRVSFFFNIISLLCSFGDVAFSEYFLYRCRFLFEWRAHRTFFPSELCFSTL